MTTVIIEAILVLVVSSPANVYSDNTGTAYSRGWHDAICDHHSCNGHGYDDSCPTGHSEDFCANYVEGYLAGWAKVVEVAGVDPNNSEPQSIGGSEAQSIGGNDIGIHGSNNKIIINQAQSQSQR
jgi:hypothetical protein